MSHIGMYQPKQKDGINWVVDFTIELKDGQTRSGHREFRVREDAQRFIAYVKGTKNEIGNGYASGKMTISKAAQ